MSLPVFGDVPACIWGHPLQQELISPWIRWHKQQGWANGIKERERFYLSRVNSFCRGVN